MKTAMDVLADWGWVALIATPFAIAVWSITRRKSPDDEDDLDL